VKSAQYPDKTCSEYHLEHQPPSEIISLGDELNNEVQADGLSNSDLPLHISDPVPATSEDITPASIPPRLLDEDIVQDETHVASLSAVSGPPSPTGLLNDGSAQRPPEPLLTDAARDPAPRSPRTPELKLLLPPSPDEATRVSTPPRKGLDIQPSDNEGSHPSHGLSPSTSLQMEYTPLSPHQPDLSQSAAAPASTPLEGGDASAQDIEMDDAAPTAETLAIDEGEIKHDDIQTPLIERPDLSAASVPQNANLSLKESTPEVVTSPTPSNLKLDAEDHAPHPTISESAANDGDEIMAVDEDTVQDASTAELDPAPSASPSTTPTATRVLRERRPQPSPSSTPGVSPEELRRSLAENPNVRSLEGDRLQCNFCGKWLTIPGWESHVSTKCRHRVRCIASGHFPVHADFSLQPRKRGPGFAAPKPLPPAKLSDTEKQSGASVLPFNAESELPDGSEGRRRNIQVMTEGRSFLYQRVI